MTIVIAVLIALACSVLCAVLIVGAAMSSARYTRNEEKHQ